MADSCFITFPSMNNIIPANPNPPSKSLSGLNDLMQNIRLARQDILKNENALEQLQQRLAKDFYPIGDEILKVRIEIFRALGKHIRAGHLNKKADKILREALFEFGEMLIFDFDADLAREMVLIFEGIDIGELSKDEDDGDEEFAFGKGDDDFDRGFSSSGSEKFSESNAKWDEQKDGQYKNSKKGRKKNLGDERDKEVGNDGDIRALYLLLARALHPDKEPDPDKKTEKTQWMQKVTAAYSEKDLAKLLDILACDPLNTLGPYLSQAPAKMVQGFAKRLRRELKKLQQKSQNFSRSLNPFVAALLKNNEVNEVAVKIQVNEINKDLKFMKQRLKAYSTTQGLHELLNALQHHEWQELM